MGSSLNRFMNLYVWFRTFTYGRHRVSTALPSAAGSLPAPLGILSARCAGKANSRIGKGPLPRKPLRLSPLLCPLPAGSDTARAAPGAEAPAAARLQGRGSEGLPAAEQEGRCNPTDPPATGDEGGWQGSAGSNYPEPRARRKEQLLPFEPQPAPSLPCVPAVPHTDNSPPPQLTAWGRPGPAEPSPRWTGPWLYRCRVRSAKAACEQPNLAPTAAGIWISAPAARRHHGKRGGARTRALIDRSAAQSGSRRRRGARPGSWGAGWWPASHVRVRGLRRGFCVWPSLPPCCPELPRVVCPESIPPMAALSQNLLGKDLWDQGVPTCGVTQHCQPGHGTECHVQSSTPPGMVTPPLPRTAHSYG